ncbi:MAG: ORF6N domain-containing protein [Thermodesulfobacteriota bacterium]|nr:ORF6N domain-containing protein [Thermodesulfobacteriota bacterium]
MAKRAVTIAADRIERSIHLIRSQKVMLDRDLAELYGVETRVLNQAVGRNVERFPEDFMFALTREEIMRISQTVTSSEIKYSRRVRAFTEKGLNAVAQSSAICRQPSVVYKYVELSS